MLRAVVAGVLFIYGLYRCVSPLLVIVHGGLVGLWQRCERERTLFRVRIAERCLAEYSV